ncbi:MAG: hypothetical protein FJ215_06320 [Ignavibacteria bacterium]|nr:hypothetical protein [Ignavibacteria bacterium]
MDFLKELAFPQSLQHVSLLHVVLGLVSLLFLPYLSLLLGSSFFSLYLGRQARKRDDHRLRRFAKDLIEMPMMMKSVPFLFGIVPLFSIILIYAQLLHGTESIAISVFTVSFFIFIVSVVLLYAYRYTIRLGTLLDFVGDFLVDDSRSQDISREIGQYNNENIASGNRVGIWGTILLFISAFLFVSATALAMDSHSWETVETIFPSMISGLTWFRFLQLLTLGVALAGGTVLFFLYSWQGGQRDIADSYSEFLRATVLPWTLIAALAQPVLLTLDLLLLPKPALSFFTFAGAIGSILSLFLIANFFYAMIKESHFRFAGFAFYLFIGAFLFLGIRDASSLSNAVRPHAAVLAAEFANSEAELKSKLGVSVVKLSPEDIFVGKCSACHAFGQKVVGPAYNDVLPKYDGKQEDLIRFILNPVKVDPAFPPMPAQGLRPSEAEAVAEFLVKTYQERK